ncbi:undecaprenyl pyrophosphate synthetase [Thraustotheca clavata]|uniref:Alkyl transferase n=1 Tax=Thraustotheca clavata TaxID=74557 RepID=A0A1V9Y6S2_9STRA|nr:undecaprenyl pyrophosphate synthetase [Thraustotheca clavata]
MEFNVLYYPYSHTLPASLQATKYVAVNTIYNAFELYWLCILPLLFLGIPLCLSCIPLEISMPYKMRNKAAMIPTIPGQWDPKWIVPKHIAVIMDGNRRYGRTRYGLPIKGHQEGSQRVVDFMHWCSNAGVKVLTVYAFSTENWGREKTEVDALMNIFTSFMNDIIPQALERDMCIRVLVSDGAKLPAHIAQAINKIEAATAHCKSFTLNICASYGSRSEMVHACQAIASKVANGTMNIDDINEATFGQHLLTKDIPDPDLMIRTSGESRISNFLLYQIAYSELLFVDKMWPELQYEDFVQIIQQYNSRKRRFGK